MSDLPEKLDYSKPEHGDEGFRALVRESFAKAAAYRRERGIPEPTDDTFMGLPVITTDELPPR